MNEPPSSRPRIDPAAVAAAAELEAGGPYSGRFYYSIGHAVLVQNFIDEVIALVGDSPVVIEVWERLSATQFRAIGLHDSMNEQLRAIAASATDRAEKTCLHCGRPLADLHQPWRTAPSWRHVECR